MTRICVAAALIAMSWAADAVREQKITAPHALFVLGIPAARPRVRSIA